jgi:hypothetical protein
MSSQRRIDSSRPNGARSDGPKTPEGLGGCHAASFPHGLTARHLVLQTESEDEFNALREGYYLRFEPDNGADAFLVDLLVSARWRQIRAESIRAALLDLATGERKRGDPGTHVALAFKALCGKGRVLDDLRRYEAHLQRSYNSAYKFLQSRHGAHGDQKVKEGPSSKA